MDFMCLLVREKFFEFLVHSITELKLLAVNKWGSLYVVSDLFGDEGNLSLTSEVCRNVEESFT